MGKIQFELLSDLAPSLARAIFQESKNKLLQNIDLDDKRFDFESLSLSIIVKRGRGKRRGRGRGRENKEKRSENRTRWSVLTFNDIFYLFLKLS